MSTGPNTPPKPSQFIAGRSGAGLSNQATFFQPKAEKAKSLAGSTLAPKLEHPVSVSRPGDARELEANQLAGRLLADMDRADSIKGHAGRAPAVVTLQNLREPGQVDAPSARDRQGLQGPAALRALPQSGGTLVSRLASRYGNGQPLDEPVRRAAEPLLGYDLGLVRIHPYEASEMAGAVAARAFTVGRHIYFDRGEYNPSTRDGMGVLLHEVAHTTQPSGEVIQRWSRIASWNFRTSDPRSADNCAPGLAGGDVKLGLDSEFYGPGSFTNGMELRANIEGHEADVIRFPAEGAGRDSRRLGLRID
jgi:hypothetical protein